MRMELGNLILNKREYVVLMVGPATKGLTVALSIKSILMEILTIGNTRRLVMTPKSTSSITISLTLITSCQPF